VDTIADISIMGPEMFKKVASVAKHPVPKLIKETEQFVGQVS